MPNVSPPITFKCRWVPNRTVDRTFTARDAARIMCRVTRSGTPRVEIERHYRQICTEASDRKGQAEQALEAAAENIESNERTLQEQLELLRILQLALDAIALIGLIIPLARPARLAALGARSVIAARVGAIEVQQAANQRTFDLVRQAAANEAQFRLRVGQ